MADWVAEPTVGSVAGNATTAAPYYTGFMEITAGQARTLHHLTAAFCREDQMPDVIKAYDVPVHENWLRVEVQPFVFLVDPEGVPQHVTMRTSQFFQT